MRYCDHCQVGYRKSVYCPIPVGDSPSSKRQYDVLDFGCIPVVLSDDLVYAFTPDAGASYRRRSASTSASASAAGGSSAGAGAGAEADAHFNESDFAVRLPQKIVQITAGQANHQNAYPDESDAAPPFGLLPGGTAVSSMVQRAAQLEVGDSSMPNAWELPEGRQPKYPFPNALPRVLSAIPASEVELLRKNLAAYARKTRYYKTTAEGAAVYGRMPVEEHQLPDGGAIDELATFLSARMRDPGGGVAGTADRCDVERRRDHVIKRSYPCHAYRNTGLRENQSGPRYKPGSAQKVLIGETGRRLDNLQPGTQNTNVLRAGAAGQDMLRGPWKSPWASPHCTTCQAAAEAVVEAAADAAAAAKKKAAAKNRRKYRAKTAPRPAGERVPW